MAKCSLGTLGTIDWQTVSGAVMTGTHGGSLTTPSLHTFVESYTILKANGDVVKVGRSEDPERMAAMAPSNGVFGIVIEMEIRCVPLEYLAAKMTSIPFDDEFPHKFCDIMRSNKYCRIIVYPSLRCATVWMAKPVDKEEAIREGASFSKDYVNFRSEEEKEWLQEFLVHMEADELEEADRALQKVLDSQLVRLKHYCGQYNHVLCKERNHGIPHADMEFGFDFDQAPDVLSALVEHFKAHRAPYYNFEMRTTRKDDAMLSCCHSRDTMWIDFQAKSERMSEFFGSMEDLLAPHAYRKHWAKGMDHTRPDYLMRQYPRLGSFLALVDDFDPNGKFRNDHVDLWFSRTKRFHNRLSVRIKALIRMGVFRNRNEAQEKVLADKKEVASLRDLLNADEIEEDSEAKYMEQ